MAETYDPTLLPTLVHMNETWEGSSTISLWDFANFNGSIELGYAFASIFLPDLVEHNGGIFLANRYTEAPFQNWMTTLDGDLTRVEAMINHIHLSDLLRTLRATMTFPIPSTNDSVKLSPVAGAPRLPQHFPTCQSKSPGMGTTIRTPCSK